MERINVIQVIGLIFIICKLTGFITWSWWFVAMPIYLPIVINGFIRGWKDTYR